MEKVFETQSNVDFESDAKYGAVVGWDCSLLFSPKSLPVGVFIQAVEQSVKCMQEFRILCPSRHSAHLKTMELSYMTVLSI